MKRLSLEKLERRELLTTTFVEHSAPRAPDTVDEPAELVDQLAYFSLVPSPTASNPNLQVLEVQGTDGDDTITVNDVGGGRTEVTLETQSGIRHSIRVETATLTKVSVEAGDGDDTFDNNTDLESVVYGGRGHDTMYGGDGTDIFHGENGRDDLRGGAGDDFLYGGDRRDNIEGGTGDDTIEGGNHNDTIDGGDGEDTIDGQDGDDFIQGGDEIDFIHGGDGDDTILGGLGNDVIWGDNNNDTLRGDGGNDNVDGGFGNDTLYGGPETDSLAGGAGNDSYPDANVSDSIWDFDDGYSGGTEPDSFSPTQQSGQLFDVDDADQRDVNAEPQPVGNNGLVDPTATDRMSAVDRVFGNSFRPEANNLIAALVVGLRDDLPTVDEIWGGSRRVNGFSF